MAKYALLIGASEYESPKIPKLSGVVKDIEAMQRVLKNPDIGGFDEVKFVSNPDSDTMRSEIEQLFMEKCQEDDVVLLYFSGHGYTDEGGNLYFLSRNTQVNPQDKLKIDTAVDAKFIHKYMSSSKSKRQVLILDCCFSGAFAEGMSAKNIANLSIKNEIGEQLGGEGRAVLTSSTATQQSFEDSGGGVYTRYLVEGIEKGAADSDNDGVITVAELHEYAKRKVQEAKPAMKPEIYPVKEGYTIRLAKAPVSDPQLEYRKKVEQYVKDGGVTDGEIAESGRYILDLIQKRLGLTSEKAKEIENQVLKPFREFQESLQEYEEVLTKVLKNKPYLSDHNCNLLKQLQQMLKLRDEDVAVIHSCLILNSEKGVDYSKLRDFLAAKNWKDADMETYRVMMKALGKSEGSYFSSEELLKFPCTDLRTIDHLWIKYSNGRFGFSVQKEIYLRVGGKLNGKYDEKACWKKFGDRVGWRVKSNWISYEQVTFDTSAPRGHLPFKGVELIGWVGKGGMFGEGIRGLGGYLFSRIETCKL